MLIPWALQAVQSEQHGSLGVNRNGRSGRAMIDLIDKEKVSLPVLMKSSTRINLNYLLYVT